MKKLASGLIILSTSAFSANAADLSSSLKDAPVIMQTATNWTGLWAAGMAGLIFNNDKLNADSSCNCSYREESYSSGEGFEVNGLGSQGLFGEIQLGYDRQLSSNLVIGVMGGLNIDDSEFEANVHAHSGSSSAIAKIDYNQKWGAVIGPRIGVPLGDDAMIYGSAGYAFGELDKIKYTVSGGGGSESGDLLPKQDTDVNGWYAELGLEKKLKDYPGLALRVAGRYTDYSSIDLYRASSGDKNCTETTIAKLDRDNLAFMFGVKYQFNQK